MAPRDDPRLRSGGSREAFVGAGGYQTPGLASGVAIGNLGNKGGVVMFSPVMALPFTGEAPVLGMVRDAGEQIAKTRHDA
jgi:hypothetical protein